MNITHRKLICLKFREDKWGEDIVYIFDIKNGNSALIVIGKNKKGWYLRSSGANNIPINSIEEIFPILYERWMDYGYNNMRNEIDRIINPGDE